MTVQRRQAEHSSSALSRKARRLTDSYRRARQRGDDDRAELLLAALRATADAAIARLRGASR